MRVWSSFFWIRLLFGLTLLLWSALPTEGFSLTMEIVKPGHSKKHPERFHLSGKSSKRPRRVPLAPPTTCKIKLSQMKYTPKPVSIAYERDGPDELEQMITEVETILGMPGEFAKYFNDPEIKSLRTSPGTNTKLLQAFQNKKEARMKHLPPKESVALLQQLCSAIHRIDAESPQKNWFGELEDPTKVDPV